MEVREVGYKPKKSFTRPDFITTSPTSSRAEQTAPITNNSSLKKSQEAEEKGSSPGNFLFPELPKHYS